MLVPPIEVGGLVSREGGCGIASSNVPEGADDGTEEGEEIVIGVVAKGVGLDVVGLPGPGPLPDGLDDVVVDGVVPGQSTREDRTDDDELGEHVKKLKGFIIIFCILD